jgi:hypothetical protein
MKSLEALQADTIKQFDDQVVELFKSDPKMNCRKAATALKTGYFNVYRSYTRRGVEIQEIKLARR